jgi:hypothetical protein
MFAYEEHKLQKQNVNQAVKKEVLPKINGFGFGVQKDN